MTATLDTAVADLQRDNAELRRQLDACRAELAARNSDFGERIEQQSATIDVLKAMSASPSDPRPVFDLIVQRARDLCNATTASLFEFDGELVHLRSTFGIEAYRTPEAFEAYHRLFPMVPTRGSITCRAILDRQTIHVRDLASEPGVSAAVRNLGHKSQISLPLLRDGVAIGAVVLSSGETGGFTDSQVALLQIFAEQAVIAITSAETYRELQQRTGDLQESLEYQTATSDVLTVISRSAFDLQAVLDTLVETAARLCDAGRSSIVIRSGDLYRYVAGFFHDRESDQMLRAMTFAPGRDSIAGRVALERQPVHIADLTADPEFAVPNAENRTALGVPLLREGEPIGVLIVLRQRVEPFTDRQIKLVRTFADQAVIAMENARLITETREALEQQTATAEVLGVINSSPGDLAPVFEAILEKAHSLCGVSHGGLIIYDGEHFRAVATRGMTEAYGAFLRSPFRAAPGGSHERLLRGERFIHTPDVRSGPINPTTRVAIEAGSRTVLLVPLRKDGVLLGLISAHRKEVRPFSEKEIALLENFAAQAVIAMENARLLGELQTRTAELAERNTAFAERIDHQAATIDVLKEMSASPGEAQPVFDLICHQARALLGTVMVGLFEYDGELVHYRAQSRSASYASPTTIAAYDAGWPRVPDRGSLTCRAILDGTTVHIRDMDAEPGVSPEIRALGVKSQISIPLMRDGRVIGAISTPSSRVDGISDTQIELLKTFAEQAVIAIQSAETWRELQARTRDLEESLEYQTATSDVLNVISRSTADVQPVLDTVTETAARLCGDDAGAILIREGEVYRFASAFGVGPEHWAALRQRRIVPGRDSIAGRAALEGRVVHVADIRADPDYALPEAVASGLRTHLGVPLLREGAVLGAISLARKRVQPYTDRQIELVRTFADQAVIAMENARLLGELQARTRDLEESLEYQTATSDVLNVISRSTSDVQPVLDTVVDTAARLCAPDSATIYIREGQVYRAVASSTRTADPEYWARVRGRTLVPGRGSMTGRVALEGRVVQIPDILADPDFAVAETVRTGRRTLLGVPLLRDSEPIGVINLARKRVEPFTERQIELVRTFADQAVSAIENARLLGELQARTRDLEESLEYQTVTSDVLNVISRSTADVQPVLDTVVETAVRLCGADYGNIAIREGEVYRFVSTNWVGSADPEHWAILRQRTIVPGRDSVAARTALEGRVVHVADVRALPDYALPEIVASGLRTGLGVPLLREGAVLGVIGLGRNRVQPYTERQIELVRTFADQAVIAMENARLLGELQARTRDLEESLEYQTATSDVLKVISRSTFDLQPILDTLVETAQRLCDSDTAALSIREGDVFRFVATRSLDPAYDAVVRSQTFAPGRESVTSRLALTGEVVHIPDMTTDPYYRFNEAVTLGKLRTVLGVPLRRDSLVVGTLNLARQRVEPFTERQIELVRTFADQAVMRSRIRVC